MTQDKELGTIIYLDPKHMPVIIPAMKMQLTLYTAFLNLLTTLGVGEFTEDLEGLAAYLAGEAVEFLNLHGWAVDLLDESTE